MWISWCMSTVQLCIKSNKVAAACRCASSSWAFLDVIWYVIIGRFCGMQQPKVGNTAEVCLGVLAIKWSQMYEITPNNQQFISQTMSALLLVLFFEFVKASLWQLQTDGEITHFTCRNNWFAEWEKKTKLCSASQKKKLDLCAGENKNTHKKTQVGSAFCVMAVFWKFSVDWLGSAEAAAEHWRPWGVHAWVLLSLQESLAGPCPPFSSPTPSWLLLSMFWTQITLSLAVFTAPVVMKFIYECVVSTFCSLAPLPVKMQIALKSLGLLFIFL